MYNERTEVRISSPERYFTRYYHDFMDCSWLTSDEKFTFLSLKRFLDVKSNSGKVFPTIRKLQEITGWGKQKVINQIKNLVNKGIVKKIKQGPNKPNLYILSDSPNTWTCNNPEEMETATDNKDEESLTTEECISILKRRGYKVKIEKEDVKEEEVIKKEPVSGRRQATDTSTHKFDLHNDTTDEPESQEPCSTFKADADELKNQEQDSTSKTDADAPKSQEFYSMSKANADEPESQEQDSMSKDGTDATFDRLREQYLAIKGEKCNDSIDEPESQEPQTSKASTDKPKSQEPDSASEADADSLFDRLWELYPVKKGKGRISTAQKKKLLKIGYDEMERAIRRYKKYVESSDYLHHQYGGTFFNEGYVDYLDANYDPESDRKAKGSSETKQKKNQFNDYPTREYDFDAIKRTMFLQ